MEQVYSENEVAKVTVTFASNQTKENRDRVLRDFSQAAYNLCLYEYNRRFTNENQDNIGSTKGIK